MDTRNIRILHVTDSRGGSEYYAADVFYADGEAKEYRLTSIGGVSLAELRNYAGELRAACERPILEEGDAFPLEHRPEHAVGDVLGLPDLFLCDCGSAEHQLIVHHVDEYGEIHCSMHLRAYGFFRRLRSAMKFLFGYKSRYGAWESLILTKAEAERLAGVLLQDRRAPLSPITSHHSPQ